MEDSKTLGHTVVQAATIINVPGALKDSNAEKKAVVDCLSRCTECEQVESATHGDLLRTCIGCNITVHANCYADALPLAQAMERKVSNIIEKSGDSLAWKCECCRRGVDRRVIKCVYCGIEGEHHAIKSVECGIDRAFWSQYLQLDAHNVDGLEKFGHVLCINWDPRRLAVHIAKERKIKYAKNACKKELTIETAKDTQSKNGAASEDFKEMDISSAEVSEVTVSDANEVSVQDPVSPGECCFCHSKAGVRIQCRRVQCAQFFHVMCAHKGKGHVELRTGHILQFQAYCERHCSSFEDIGDLLAKLITRPIRLLVGRDDMRRFGTIAKHLPNYTSGAQVMRDLATLIVGYCDKGLRGSKSDPPDYNVKHLQMLQFFLSHVPQLEKVYALPETPLQDYVNDKKLFRRLEKMFNPLRYLAKYPGPYSQQYNCEVCQDPFHERQHLFYCTVEDTPHVQHWRCTKRRSNLHDSEVRGGCGAKKKQILMKIVENGAIRDIMLPKGLTSISDDIICGVCGAGVDARGLIASRKELKRVNYIEKESKFVQSGCYINAGGAKVKFNFCNGSGSNASSRKPPRPSDGKLTDSLMGQHIAHQALGPPKMERINVQRTTKWLACVAQIIRQAGAPNSNTPLPAASPAIATVAGAKSLANKPAESDLAAALCLNDTSSYRDAEDTSTLIVPTSKLSGLYVEATESHNQAKYEKFAVYKGEPEEERTPTAATSFMHSTRSSTVKNASLVSPAMQALFDEAMRLVQPYDSYAQSKLETAYDYLVHRSGPGVAVLRMLTHEYTRFVYIKHTRAIDKARNEKRKRAEHDAQEYREKERKRINLEAEQALKKQMMAVRNKQRQHPKALSSK